MAKDVRERMVAGATKLLASKGLQATSFSEVIELTDTPRGSIYHHFPGGKDEMVLAALDQSRHMVADVLDQVDGKDAEQVLKAMVAGWRQLLVGHEFTTGCAVVAVTVATDSDELLNATGEIFTDWTQRLAQGYQDGGLAPEKAEVFASLTLSTIEGAVVIARAQRSIESYDKAVKLLPSVLQTLR